MGPDQTVSVLDLIGRYGIIPALFIWALVYIKSEHALNRKESRDRELALAALVNGTIKELSASMVSMNQLITSQIINLQEQYRSLSEANRAQREEHKDQKDKLDDILTEVKSSSK